VQQVRKLLELGHIQAARGFAMLTHLGLNAIHNTVEIFKELPGK
jgi:hypothetical protein